MANGRPPGIALDTELPGPVAQQVVEIDRRGRLRLPNALVRSIPWLGSDAKSVDALVVLDEPGRLGFLSWEQQAPAVLDRRRELIEQTHHDDSVAEALRLLEDRYKRVAIPQDLRPTLTAEILLHLELSVGAPARVYLVRLFDRLDVLSPQYRNERLVVGSDALAGLP